MAVSCEEKPQTNTYMRVVQGSEDLLAPSSELIVEYIIHSDYTRWKFVVTCDDGGDWVQTNPRDCEMNCKFKVRVCENAGTISRTARIDFVLEDGGAIIKTFNIIQEGKQ